jgi:hypothetical protein
MKVSSSTLASRHMTMHVLGRAIARLATRVGGQLMVEVPDDLEPAFVASLVAGANAEVPRDPDFAWFVRDQRNDVGSTVPTCDFHELAIYRQGNRLAVSFTSDNSGKTTYSSVYPLLFSRGFPDAGRGTGDAGIASLTDFASALADVLEEAVGTFGLEGGEFSDAVGAIVLFLASAHQEAGNGQSSFATDWWLHLEDWVESLSLPVGKGEPSGLSRMYGAAGLPAPVASSMQMTPREYVRVLKERWSDPRAIMAELGRLQGIERARDAAALLAKGDWDQSHAKTSLRTDSPVSRVAVAAGIDRALRVHGWSRLSERDFKDSYVDARGKLRILRHGVDLRAPWKGATPVTVAAPDEVAEDGTGEVALAGIALVIPFKGDGDRSMLPEDLASVSAGIKAEGGQGCHARMDTTSCVASDHGLCIQGTLHVRPSTRAPNTVVLEVACVGPAAAILSDRCSGTFTVLRPTDVAVWARPGGGKGAQARRAPLTWSLSEPKMLELGLPTPGRYEFALAWGERAAPYGALPAVGPTQLEQQWPGAGARTAQGLIDVAEAVQLSLAGHTICRVEVALTGGRPLSPVIAAAHGVLPDCARTLREGTFSHLERALSGCLSHLGEPTALGCVLASASEARLELRQLEKGVQATSDLIGRLTQLVVGPPSPRLVNLPAYVRLRRAYGALGLAQLIVRIEEEESTAGLTVSRVPLSGIPRDAIDELLSAYIDMLLQLDGLATSDRFWARHPFSVVVFADEGGVQAARAVLMSPLHPIRLAWRWTIEVGLRAAFDDGVKPASSLALLDGTSFPAYSLAEDAFGEPQALLPVPVDAHPDEVYFGWHASVAVVNDRPAIPDWVAGNRFPVAGLSSLSQSSVGGAIDDFLRVAPHVQVLKVELAAASSVRRSPAIDDGILAKLDGLAIGSTRLDGVAGVQVVDSTNRRGPIPPLDRLEGALSLARHGFNVQWTSAAPGIATGSHVTFLEGSAAQVVLRRADGLRRGWMPHLPLRRTPHRTRRGNFVTLDFSLSDVAAAQDRLSGAIAAYEVSADGRPFVLSVIPNLAAIDGRPNWLVAADFGVDPQSLAQAAARQAGQSYVLWDWRPVSAVRANDGTGRVQPYFVLAAIPDALNSALRERLLRLKPGMAEADVANRTRTLVGTLAARAIGLNTLLSVGHHQATGALGFFFALRSLTTWMAAGTDRDIRLVVPVDAVDWFLRESLPTGADGRRRRADLLAIRALLDPEETPQVILVPIELKHYGLSNGEMASQFPLAGQPRFDEHVEQLRTYQQQVAAIVEAYRSAAGMGASIIGQRFAALVDAAVQLGPEGTVDASALLDSIAAGRARIELGKGVLAWYQPGATGSEGKKAESDEVSGSLEVRRIDVRIDPAAFDDCYWEGRDGLCHVVMREAMDSATNIGSGRSTCEPAVVSSADEGGAPIDEARGGSQAGPQFGGAAARSGQASEPELSATSAGGMSSEPEGPPTVADERAQPRAATSTDPGHPARERLSRSELERRYKTLLGALTEFGVKVERPPVEVPYQEGPGFVEYSVRPSYGVAVSRVESQLENVKLRLELPAGAVVGCSTHLGNIVVTVPKIESERYFVDAEAMWDRWSRPPSGFVLPLGEDIAGNIVTLDLASSNSPHLLIAGVTGSGKSEALLTMLHGATRFYSERELKLLLVDPKGTELTSLAALEHTMKPIGSGPQDAIAFLEMAVKEMEARYARFRDAGDAIRSIGEFQHAGGEMPRWLLVLDEYADLVSDDGERAKIERSIQRLSQKARAAGIHLILSTQKPVVAVVNTVLKGNLPGRIALRVNTAVESRVILDEGGAEQLVGKGDALVKVGNSKQRVQFARYALL